jgi:hypothetical protein
MSVMAEIRTERLQLTRRPQAAKGMQSETFSFLRDPDLAVVLTSAVVGLLLSVLFPLSEATTIQLAQML